ncbi:MAG: NAD-dependent succinate-semialdehyde dehydrogenase [Actinomycetota bacterium]|jgi:succinate-semialdehyde dehydrogenase/glutarate-semialdehyde dehydrogenase|nr:NAD-dependent succinate-semialdehyde dehydrogenase [Actinomycetota bacterium]
MTAIPPIATVDPTTGDVLETFQPLSDRELEERLALAAQAATAWAATDVGTRSRLLVTAAELLEGELPDIAYVLTKEMGKPFAQAKGEVAKCATALRWFADHGPAMLADEPVETNASSSCVVYQPLGAVLAVMPWNFPLWQVIRFAAPALLAGNVGLLKHAPNVPRSALLLEYLFTRAGAPAGVFQTLLIDVDRVPAVIADPRVAAVTLTGSVRAGRAVATQAGAAGKKVVLELGGSDPFIVLPDADLERAVAVGVQARVQNNGQSCIAAKRFIVHEAVADEFTERFVAAMDALAVGDPLEPATEVGPLVSAAARDGIEAQVEDARSTGASILCGGQRVVGPAGPDRPGFFYRPTVVSGILPGMRVATEEVFGPVALLSRAADTDAALAMANASDFGLGASVWTADPVVQERFIRDLVAGQVFVNGMVTSMPELPFGGVKASGVGRELSAHGIHEFCNIKAVWVA